MSNKSKSKRMKSISFHKVYDESIAYCIGFCKRRPIMASLIALELGSWAYFGLKRFAKSFIWWNTVLELEIKGDYTLKPKDPLDELLNIESSKRLSFLQLIHTIHGAAKDKRIRALLIRIESDLMIGVAQCEELRNTLLQFKEKYGKPIIVYADNIASWTKNGVRHYYIASVATQIIMSADGRLHLGPATVDYPFLNSGLKDKLDITVEVRRRAQYKSAGNILARDEFDEFHKEQYTQLIQHLEKNFVDTIAKSRLLKPYNIPRDIKTIQCIQWIALQITKENNHLEFTLKEIQTDLLANIKEEKSDEWNDELMYLVHCWSWNDGDYKHPVLFVVLQFYDKNKKSNVFYQATVTHPTKRLGKLQRGGDGDPDEISKELTYEVLNGFEPGEYCVELVKPGDIDVPDDDKKLDEDHGRGEIRASLAEQHIVIRRNVNDILHHGSYSTAEAQTLGLIDATASYSDVYSKIIPNILNVKEKKISYLYLHRYYARIFKSKLSSGIPDIINTAEDPSSFQIMKYIHPSSTKIAYIAATNGTIMDGESSKDIIGSTTLCRQLRAARKKKEIKGVILHLNTPGGSATACHNMWCEIKELINASKPVIAVQSNVSASGGYYLSAPCSYIISSPSSITGSIGIIGLKLCTKKFWKNKLGVNYDRVSTHPLAASQYSQLDGYGEYERIRMEQSLTEWYKRFKGVIAEPRDMESDKVETVAKGQVWLGSQALEIGLVDELGGIYEGITKMKELLNIPSYRRIKLVNPLGKRSVWDILLGTTPENENDFSVPRTSFGSVLNNMINFVNPISWLKHSGCVNLILSNIISSPMISSVLLMSHGLSDNNNININDWTGIMDIGDGNRMFNDMKFMANQLRIYQNNAILMYSSPISYFNHNMLHNGQL